MVDYIVKIIFEPANSGVREMVDIRAELLFVIYWPNARWFLMENSHKSFRMYRIIIVNIIELREYEKNEVWLDLQHKTLVAGV